MSHANKDQLIEALNSLHGSTQIGMSLYILKWEMCEDGRRLTPFSTQYNENSILPEMKQHILHSCISNIRACDSFCEYDPTINPDEKVIWTFDLSLPDMSIPTYSESIAPLSEENGASQMPSDTDLAEDIHGIMFHFFVWEEGVFLFRKNWPKRVLKKGGPMKLVFGWWTLSALPDEDTLTIPSWADCLFHKEACYIFDRNGFRSLFNFHEIEKARAQTTIDALKSGMNFEFWDGFDLSHLIDDHHSIWKLSRPDKLVNRAAPFPKLCDINERYSLGLTMDPATEKVVLNDRKEAKKFLKILNDDYLKSEVSDKMYDSHSKESLTS